MYRADNLFARRFPDYAPEGIKDPFFVLNLVRKASLARDRVDRVQQRRDAVRGEVQRQNLLQLDRQVGDEDLNVVKRVDEISCPAEAVQERERWALVFGVVHRDVLVNIVEVNEIVLVS